MGTGLSRVFAHALSSRSKETAGNPTDSNPMEYRRLGELEVSAIGFGCLPMAGYYGRKYDKREMLTLIRRAHSVVCLVTAVQSECVIYRKPDR